MNKRKISLILILVLVFSNFIFASQIDDSSRNVQTKRYIIQFDDKDRDLIKQRLNIIDGVTINYEYDIVMNGLSVEIKMDVLDKLLQIKEITNIQESFPVEPATFNAKKLSKIVKAMENTNFQGKNYGFDGRGMVIATIDSGVDTAHKDLRLDDDAKADVKIKNITAGGNFTLKVPHGFNYVEGNRNVKDDFEWAHGQHIAGILAGCASEEEAEKGLGVRGVAPNAQLLAYKIFTDNRADDGFMGTSGDDSVYHAMEDAIKHGADVISLSIGEPGFGRRGDLYGSAIENAKKHGVIVCVSMGNYGAQSSGNTYDNNSTELLGMKDTSIIVSGAANKNGIGVGAAKNTKNFMDAFVLDGEKYPYEPIRSRMYELAPKQNKVYDFVFLGRGFSEDYEGIDVNGKVVVALRGGESVWDKIERANINGAEGFILVNDITNKTRDTYLTEFPIYFEYMDGFSKGDRIWAIGITGNEGRELFNIPSTIEERIKPSKTVMTKEFYVANEKIEAIVAEEPRVSGFSSWGPNAMLELKPDIVAPGQEIISTGIVKDGRDTYVRMSGTSMSTPHVAGISTLLLSKVKADMQALIDNEGFDRVDLVKHIMMNTAKPLKDYNGLETSPRQQGAGFADVDAAFANNVIISYSKMPSASLKEIASDVDEKEFELTLYNFGEDREEFDLSFSSVLTDNIQQVKKINEDYIESVEGEIHPQALNSCDIRANKNIISVAANSKATVLITLNTKGAMDGFVEGYIYFKPTANSSASQPELVFPYMAYKGDFGAENIIDAPMWEENSKTKLTCLMAPEIQTTGNRIYKPMGLDENGNINPDMIAMSNEQNYPGVIKEVVPRIIALRDAVDYEVSLVDKKDADAQSLFVFAKGNVFKKFINSYYVERNWYKDIVEEPDYTMEWKGFLFEDQYNGSTKDGLYTPRTAKEGQYYLRLKFRNSMDKDYQLTYLPLKIDNTKPELDKLNYDSDKQELSISFKENFGMRVPTAKLDNKVLEDVERIDNTSFVFKNVKLNVLSSNKLVINARDYANIPCSYTENISEKLFSYTNLAEIKKGTQANMTLKGTYLSDKVDSIVAILNGNMMNVSLLDGEFEIALNGLQDKNILKLVFKQKGKVIAEKETKIHRDKMPPVFEFDVEYDSYGKVVVDNFGNYEIKGKLSDNISNSEDIKLYYSYNIFDKKTIKRAKVNADSTFSIKVNADKYPVIYLYAIDESGNKTDKLANYFNPQEYYSGNGYKHSVNGQVVARHGVYAIGNDVIYPKHPWLMVTSDSIMHDSSLSAGSAEDAYTKVAVRGNKGQRLEVRSYNPSKRGFQPIEHVNGEDGVQTYYFSDNGDVSDLEARLLYGFNCVNIKVYDGEQIVFDRGYTFFLDLQSPNIEFYNVSPYNYDGSMVDGYDGVFYAKNETFDIEGAIDDDSYEMTIYVNDSEVTRWSLFGEMNQKRRFIHTHKAKDGDFIRIKAADVAGYEEEFSYKVVIDNKVPNITLYPAGELNDDSVLSLEVSDEISADKKAGEGYVESVLTVNGRLYKTGDKLSAYKTDSDSGYYILAKAVDRAGNETVVEKRIGVQDSKLDQVALKNNIPMAEEFTNPNQILELNGFNGKCDFIEFAPYYESRSDEELRALGYVNLDSVNPYKIVDKIQPLQAKEFSFFVRFEDNNGIVTIEEFTVNRDRVEELNAKVEVIVYQEDDNGKIIPYYNDANFRYRQAVTKGKSYKDYPEIIDFISYEFDNGNKTDVERMIESIFIRQVKNFGVPENTTYDSVDELKNAIISGGDKDTELIFIKIK